MEWNAIPVSFEPRLWERKCQKYVVSLPLLRYGIQQSQGVPEGREEVCPHPRLPDGGRGALGTASLWSVPVLRGHWPAPQQAEGRDWCWAQEGQDCLTATPHPDPGFWVSQTEALPRASLSLSTWRLSCPLLQLAALSVPHLSPQPGHTEKPKEEKVL